MVHAENHNCITWLTDRLLRSGETAPRFHATSRPIPVEREAVHRVISLAELVDIPIMIVHVSSNDAVEQIRWAQNRGRPVYAETCPQYLFLTEADLDRQGFEGAKYICSPPMRDNASQEALWWGLQHGVFQVFSSDHAPFRYDDPRGKKVHGADAPFSKVPNGIPGLEVRMPLLYSEGVGKDRISQNAFVALTATNHAKMYGLYPRKGTIAIGSDADIAIWDPNLEVTISTDMLHDSTDYTPFEGVKVRGWPVITISRGEIVWEEGQVKGEPGRGEFLPCAIPDSARPGLRPPTRF
jgi:dihydropyrimidinase